MATGLRASSSLQILSIENLIHYLAYKKFPFLSMFMDSNPKSPSFMGKVTDTTHKWNEKRLKTNRGELYAAIAAAATTMYDSNIYADYIAGKTVVKVDDEYMTVSAVTVGSSYITLTVVRGFNSSTDAAHDANAETIIMNPHNEAHVPTRNDAQYGDQQYNYTEIFYKTIAMSGTSQAVKTYGDELKVDKQLAEKLPSLLEDFQNAMIHGTRYSTTTGGSGSDETIRMMGGLIYWIPTSMTRDNKGSQFTLNTLADDVHELVQNGVDPGDLVMSCGNDVLKTIEDRKATIVQETMSINKLDYSLKKIIVPGNYEVTVLPHASLYPANEYNIFPRKAVKAKALRPLSKDKLAKTGDLERWQAVMEATAEFHNFQKGGAIRRKNVS